MTLNCPKNMTSIYLLISLHFSPDIITFILTKFRENEIFTYDAPISRFFKKTNHKNIVACPHHIEDEICALARLELYLLLVKTESKNRQENHSFRLFLDTKAFLEDI